MQDVEKGRVSLVDEVGKRKSLLNKLNVILLVLGWKEGSETGAESGNTKAPAQCHANDSGRFERGRHAEESWFFTL